MSVKRIIGILVFSISVVFGSVVCHADGISVYVNNKQVYFDVQPQMINDRTMVPMRKIFESLGAVVTWDDQTQTATGKKGDTTVNVSIDSTTLFKNGVPKLLDVAPALIGSRTLVPVRAIAESFDCTVEWIDATQTVKIYSNDTSYQNKPSLSAQEISEKVSPSIFYIEVYGADGHATASGSGFFITSDGVAVTNYHVIEDTNSAIITTTGGSRFGVSNVLAYDADLDVAIIKVSRTDLNGNTVGGFSPVTLGDSDAIKAGQTVYALGSPVGLQNTISNGIISNTNQIVDNSNYIQITAAISHGSSGGALVNEYGEVLGITSAGIESAQNIGFAIPINTIKGFDFSSAGVSYEEFANGNSKFVIELFPDSIELAVGESQDVYVYADGKGDDWSIYWETDQNDIVSCEWGPWLEDADSVCTLKITGIYPGYAKVTVYSDVDFEGKDIYVDVKKPSVVTYPGTVVPTYSAITGLALVAYDEFENNNCYSYEYNNINLVQMYVDYLLDNGFEYVDEDFKDNIRDYYYRAPNGDLIIIALAYEYNQVWIYTPR